jgi:hypothetical protein
MTAHEILRAAKAVGEERGWHQGHGDPNGSVCIMVALNIVATGSPRRAATVSCEHMRAMQAFAKCAGARDFTFISWWWDVASPVERERVLDRAIEVTASAEAAGR